MTSLIARLEALTEEDVCKGIGINIELEAMFPQKGITFGIIPPYIASIDAAVALAERVLPNERVQINRIAFEGKRQWRVSLTGAHTSWSSSPALALCIATLKAKEASDD